MKSCAIVAMNRPFGRQQGLSLVEVMVAVGIGMFLLLGLSSLLVANSQTSQELNKKGSQIENGRFAIQLLSDDIRLAGFLDTYTPTGATWTIPTDPCATTLANLGFSNKLSPVVSATVTVPVAIHGYTGADALPSSCASVVTNRLAGTGVLIVRRVSTMSIAPAAASASPYLQVSGCADSTIDTVPFVLDTDNTKFTLRKKDCLSTNLAPVREYRVHIYYVSSCSDCTANDGIPTLMSAEFKGGVFTTSPLVEGIENMQLDYGIDMNGDGAVDCYTSNPTAPPPREVDPTAFPASACPQTATPYVWTSATTNWSNVMTVRVNLLARNLQPSTGWTDNRTYDMGLAGGTTTATNDAYKRHVYSTVARLYNISGQRE